MSIVVCMEPLGERPVWSMSGSEMLATLDQLDAEIARQQTYRLQVVAGLDDVGYAHEIGAHDTVQLLAFRYRLDRAEAHRDVRLARALPKYAAVSAKLPTVSPTADDGAATDGDNTDDDNIAAVATDDDKTCDDTATGDWLLRPAQAEAIVSALERVPTRVPVEHVEVAEQQLVNLARHLSPAELRKAGKQINDLLDTDGPEPDEHKAYAREALTLSTADNGVKFRGFLANENAELLRALIHAGARPHKTIDGEPDPRSREKRQADALTTALTIAATATETGDVLRNPRPTTPTTNTRRAPSADAAGGTAADGSRSGDSAGASGIDSSGAAAGTGGAAANGSGTAAGADGAGVAGCGAVAGTGGAADDCGAGTGAAGCGAGAGAGNAGVAGCGAVAGAGGAAADGSGAAAAAEAATADGCGADGGGGGAGVGGCGAAAGSGGAGVGGFAAAAGAGVAAGDERGVAGSRSTAGGSNWVPGFGAKANITVTIDLNDLKAATANATGQLVYGDGLSAAAIRRLACDAKIIPLVLGSNSEPLDVGRAERLVNRAIRRALNARDRGCVVCGAPPIQCDAHHLVHWIDGGETCVTNVVLLCRRHHIDLHAGHWTIQMIDGVVHVARPTWADPPPRRTPRAHQTSPPSQPRPGRQSSPGDPAGLNPSAKSSTRGPTDADRLDETASDAACLDPWGEPVDTVPGGPFKWQADATTREEAARFAVWGDNSTTEASHQPTPSAGTAASNQATPLDPWDAATLDTNTTPNTEELTPS
jgi:hypothetical protein